MAVDSEEEPTPAYEEQGGNNSNDLMAFIEAALERGPEIGLPLKHLCADVTPITLRKDSVLLTRAGETHGQTNRGAAVGEEDGSNGKGDEIMMTVPRHDVWQNMVDRFFRLICRDQAEGVTLFVQKGLVSPSLVDSRCSLERLDWGAAASEAALQIGPNEGVTPLLEAVAAGQADMVRLLVHLGADVNQMGFPPPLRPLDESERKILMDRTIMGGSGLGPDVTDHLDALLRRQRQMPPGSFRFASDPRPAFQKLERLKRRTPLMLAAEQGRLLVAKTLLQEAHADDGQVAPDGQTALRLAAARARRQHRQRRGEGGDDGASWLDAEGPGHYGEIVALLPARRAGAGRRFRTALKRSTARIQHYSRKLVHGARVAGQVFLWQVPKYVVWTLPRQLAADFAEAAVFVWTHWQEVPQQVWSAMVETAKAMAQLARYMGRVARRIPGALQTASAWVGSWLAAAASTVAAAAANVASALHTALVAVWTWCRAASLADVAHALSRAAVALVTTVPRILVDGLRKAAAALWDSLVVLLGIVGVVVQVLALCVGYTVAYVPRQLWKMLVAVGSVLGSALSELVVLVNPKF